VPRAARKGWVGAIEIHKIINNLLLSTARVKVLAVVTLLIALLMYLFIHTALKFCEMIIYSAFYQRSDLRVEICYYPTCESYSCLRVPKQNQAFKK
jgi:hypothetical protein